MSAIAKIQHNGQVTIPTSVRNRAGLSEGDLVEFSIRRGKIVIIPKAVIDRSKFPTAAGEYTPEQRRIIDASLDEAEKGPFFGPFKNGTEVAAFLRKKQRSGKPTTVKKAR